MLGYFSVNIANDSYFLQAKNEVKIIFTFQNFWTFWPSRDNFPSNITQIFTGECKSFDWYILIQYLIYLYNIIRIFLISVISYFKFELFLNFYFIYFDTTLLNVQGFNTIWFAPLSANVRIIKQSCSFQLILFVLNSSQFAICISLCNSLLFVHV